MRAIIILLVVALYLGVGFYPFQWAPPLLFHDNGIEEINHGELSFLQPGIAFTPNSPEWVSTAIEDTAFEVELEVLPYKSVQYGPARIFTISQDHYHCNLTIGQDKENLIVRLRTPVTGMNGDPGLIVPQVFSKPGPHRILVRATPQIIKIEVDGQQALTEPLPPDAFSNWDPGYRLAIGNEFTFYRPWLGQVQMATVRVQDKKFPYVGAELQRPATYIAARPDLRYEIIPFSPPVSITHILNDLAVNFLGFLPFGLLLVAVRGTSFSLAQAVLCCGALSLSIELGQFFFDRTPSLIDLLLNTLGGTLGAWAGYRSRFLTTSHYQ
jgi:VanZ family protein